MAMKKANNEIVPAQSAELQYNNLSVVDVDTAVAQWEAYQEVTKRILDDSDYLKIGDREFKKKSAWRKYKRAFNVSTEILEKNIVKLPNGRTQEAEFIVRATLPDGTFSEGFGVCSIDEYHGNKPNHDIPATAQTRATNRAISDLIGAGEVTAEEAKNGIIEDEIPKKPKTSKKNKKVNEAIEIAPEDIEIVEE